MDVHDVVAEQYDDDEDSLDVGDSQSQRAGVADQVHKNREGRPLT